MTFRADSLENFVEKLASKQPVPGGGGAAALASSLGMALSNMTGNLTTGKKKYQDVEEKVQDLLKQGNELQKEFLKLIDKDAECFRPLAKAYGLPANTENEKIYKDKMMEKASIEACLVPLAVMEKAYQGLVLADIMSDIGSKLVISDVGCAVLLLKAGLLSASLNVKINLNSIQDRNFLQETEEKMTGYIQEGCKKADFVYEKVLAKL